VPNSTGDVDTVGWSGGGWFVDWLFGWWDGGRLKSRVSLFGLLCFRFWAFMF